MKLYITNAVNSYQFVGILDLVEQFKFSLMKGQISTVDSKTAQIVIIYKNSYPLVLNTDLYEETYLNNTLTSLTDIATYIVENIPIGGGDVTNDHSSLINRDAAGNHNTFTPIANSTASFKITDAESNVLVNVDSTNDLLQVNIDKETIRGKYDYHRQVAGTDTDGDWRTYSDANGFYIDIYVTDTWVNRLTVQATE